MTRRPSSLCSRRALLRAASAAALLPAFSCAAPATGFEPARAVPSIAPATAPGRWPLRVHPSRRCLAGANGQPFLLHGEAAWSLIGETTREDADRYLTDRAGRGFNTILVSLLEYRFSRNAPANAYGDAPFQDGADFIAPNETYFVHADWIIARARALGLSMLITPAYLGFGGGADGWYHTMLREGPTALRRYGAFIGARYRGFDNIAWVNGGDYAPPNRDIVRAVAEGIRETAPNALMTAHCGPEQSARDYWEGEPWLDFDAVYTYNDTGPPVRASYAREPVAPVILFESAYENEHGAGGERVRRQAYEALVSGACGHVFGNNPIWHFDGPGVHPAPSDWETQLDSAGARSMTHLKALFDRLPWWDFAPDANLAEGARISAARGAGHGMIYMAEGGALTLARTPRRARWFDPSNGEEHAARSARALSAPPQNAAGERDWVLLVED